VPAQEVFPCYIQFRNTPPAVPPIHDARAKKPRALPPVVARCPCDGYWLFNVFPFVCVTSPPTVIQNHSLFLDRCANTAGWPFLDHDNAVKCPGRRQPFLFNHRTSIDLRPSTVIFVFHRYQLPEPGPPISHSFIRKSLSKRRFTSKTERCTLRWGRP
jgi:hypothetical protein